MHLLAFLFLASSIVMYFANKSEFADIMKKMATMDPNSIYPREVNGMAYTVAALKEKIFWESWSQMIVNFILAIIMGSLSLWSRRAPLAAMLIATATYAVLIVGSAIINPISIGQGILIKIVVAMFLTRGIKAALTMRTINA